MALKASHYSSIKSASFETIIPQKMRFFRSLLIVAATQLLTRTSGASAVDGFGPLQCNVDASIHSDECLSNAVGFSTLFSEEELFATLTIPCGRCVTMDYTDGETITIPGGLNVVGRLHFPSSTNVVVRTTAVFVQGSWSMDIPGEGNRVTVSLFGSEEQTLYPHNSCCENIDDAYGYDCSCSMAEGIGKKPFVVAGGKCVDRWLILQLSSVISAHSLTYC
eukprot:CAMPEP_0171295950 /NCGR_PEP_ID=MMETSP0816-20121228/4613_1 /TAXON_ID=420281 /ORGANISM="Proboscia inermis, Strain CCAP1064/1" /LENGTH=220 /DNA_ID=CAMNT_0011769025 /DNA_START=46 /DNA_END=705 /DNA_ORIENTATION=+